MKSKFLQIQILLVTALSAIAIANQGKYTQADVKLDLDRLDVYYHVYRALHAYSLLLQDGRIFPPEKKEEKEKLPERFTAAYLAARSSFVESLIDKFIADPKLPISTRKRLRYRATSPVSQDFETITKISFFKKGMNGEDIPYLDVRIEIEMGEKNRIKKANVSYLKQTAWRWLND